MKEEAHREASEKFRISAARLQTYYNAIAWMTLWFVPSREEVDNLFKRMEAEEPKYAIDVAVGDTVRINDGPFKDYEGKVSDVDEARGKVKVFVSIFGRETPVELDFLQIKKL